MLIWLAAKGIPPPPRHTQDQIKYISFEYA